MRIGNAALCPIATGAAGGSTATVSLGGCCRRVIAGPETVAWLNAPTSAAPTIVAANRNGILSLLSDDDLTLDGAQWLPAGEHRGDHVVQPGTDVGQRQGPLHHRLAGAWCGPGLRPHRAAICPVHAAERELDRHVVEGAGVLAVELDEGHQLGHRSGEGNSRLEVAVHGLTDEYIAHLDVAQLLEVGDQRVVDARAAALVVDRRE